MFLFILYQLENLWKNKSLAQGLDQARKDGRKEEFDAQKHSPE